jgi:MarR-like DNA-binding transcriptional regulator SgrR of sgrS sRNA
MSYAEQKKSEIDTAIFAAVAELAKESGQPLLLDARQLQITTTSAVFAQAVGCSRLTARRALVRLQAGGRLVVEFKRGRGGSTKIFVRKSVIN